MTIEEAIDYFKRSYAVGDRDEDRQHDEALEMAIEALEQKPCEDCVSRQEAVRIAEQGQTQGYEWQFKKLCNLPSVKPQQTGHWIDNHNGTFVCDRCGCRHSKSNYCPNCGVEMEVQNVKH